MALISTHEAAKILGVTIDETLALADDDELTTHRLDPHDERSPIRFDLEEVEALAIDWAFGGKPAIGRRPPPPPVERVARVEKRILKAPPPGKATASGVVFFDKPIAPGPVIKNPSRR